MKKELLKKLKYNMPKEEEPMMELEMEGGEEGPELEISMEEEEGGLMEPGESGDLSMFSEEELQAELDKRRMKEEPEEELA